MGTASDAGAATVLVVVGAGGHGREVVGVVRALEQAGQAPWTFAGVAAAQADPVLLERLGVDWLGPEERVVELGASYSVAIGDPQVRRTVAARLDSGAGRPVTLVHPSATIDQSATLDPGVLVPAGAVVGPAAHLARHVHLNVNAVVGAGAQLAPFATLSPGSVVEADAHLGAGVLVGAGAVVLEGRRLGDGAVAGAGSVVEADVAAGLTVVGVPARRLDAAPPR